MCISSFVLLLRGPIVVQRTGAENADSRKASLRDSGLYPP